MDFANQSLESLLLLLSNVIREPWVEQTSVLNVGEQMVKKAISETFQVQLAKIRTDYQSIGDLGQLCFQYKKQQPTPFVKPKSLTIDGVLNVFRQIGDISGQNSTSDRVILMRRLYQDGSAIECKYLTKLLLSKNRLGMQRHSFLVSLADLLCYKMLVASNQLKPIDSAEKIDATVRFITSFKVSNKIIDVQDDESSESESETVQKTQNAVVPDFNNCDLDALLDKIPKDSFQVSAERSNVRVDAHRVVGRAFARVPSLVHLAKNLEGLEGQQICPGIPILPMLAKPVSSAEEALQRAGTAFACEFKYDGFRAQVHCVKGKIQIFSRSQENMSQQFYDVIKTFELLAPKFDFIVDGEIVPYGPDGILPFQLLSRRLKVYDEKSDASKVKLFLFDIMLVNGRSLMNAPFKLRRQILHTCFQQNDLVQFAESEDIVGEEQLLELLNKAVAAKTEGLIIKTLDSMYVPDRRSRHWLKVKKDYLEGIGDSLDLVPIAGWYGHGKRTGVIGAYLMASLNGQTYETVTNVGTGFSDEQLATFTQYFQDKKQLAKPSNIKIADQFLGQNKPDFWIKPEDSIVLEIKVANLSISNMHTCYNQKLQNGGIAARLPRLLRERTDKSTDNCSTSQFVYERFCAQPERASEEAQQDCDKTDSEIDDEEIDN